MLVLIIVLIAVVLLVAVLAGGWVGGWGAQQPTIVRRVFVRRPTRRVVEEPVMTRRVYDDEGV
jgi:hypothetical protein